MNKAHCDESLLHLNVIGRCVVVRGGRVETVGSICSILNEARYLHMSGPIVVLACPGKEIL